MTRLLFVRCLKTLFVTAPFFIMITMVLALWGVGGKVSYAELNLTPKTQIEPAPTKVSIEQAQCATNQNLSNKGEQNFTVPALEAKKPEFDKEGKENAATKKDALRATIKWDLVV